MKNETEQTPANAFDEALAGSIQGSRHARKFIARFVEALLRTRSSNLARIAAAIESEAEAESVNHELPNEDRQAIAEHLLHCEKCRMEHDEIRFGAALASNLKRADAPEYLWGKIENALDGKSQSQTSLIPHFSFLNLRGLSAAAILIIGGGLVAAVYFGLSATRTEGNCEKRRDTQSNREYGTASNRLNVEWKFDESKYSRANFADD